ncbi:MAG: protein kinase [Thermoanaerobaculia bacterium]
MAALIEGKYEVIAKLKEGGMGAIYKVRHVLLDEIRVIKVMRPQIEDDPDAQRRFQQEAKLATSLKHPNIAAQIDFAEDKDHTFYMVMEFIDGVNLSEFVAKSGPPPIPTTLDIGMQTLSALGYLHKRGIIHRDISPENIMLTRDAEGQVVVKLIDLGVAKQTGSAGMTVTGMFVGKLKYGSPEQLGVLKAGEVIDGRSDMYSLGCVLYQTLTGQSAFEADSMQAYVMHHLMHPPRPFEETDPDGRVPPEVRSAILKSLEKKRDDRWANTDEFAEALWVARERLRGSPGEVEETRAMSELDRMQALKTPAPERPSGVSDAQALLAQAFAKTTPPPGGTARTSSVAPPRFDRTPRPAPRQRVPEVEPATGIDDAESPTSIQSQPGARLPSPTGRTVIDRAAPPLPSRKTVVAPRDAPQVLASTRAKKSAGGSRVWMMIAAAAVVILGIAGVILMRRKPDSASAAKTGSVLLTAEPWGRVVRVRDETRGKPIEDAAIVGMTTPVRLELPPGRYSITLKCDSLKQETTQNVEVVSQQAVTAHAVIPEFDLERAVASFAP